MTNLAHRRDYADDPSLCDRVFDLLDTWIPALRGMRDRAERLHWRWEDVSTPFVQERGSRVVSHVGVLEQTWVIDGEERLLGGIHAVCTLESERRKGLYRVLMEELLAHCDERYATLELSTENPEYYEPFGFRRVPEYRFRTRVGSPGGTTGFRPLALGGSDVELLERLLESRVPISRSFSVVAETAVFKFNEGNGQRLHYCEELDLIAVMSIDAQGALELNDLVAPRIPSLASLLARIASPVREVVFHFNPEQLEVDATAERAPDGDVLMVRGEFPFVGTRIPPGMIPPSSRH